jgi:hypothetical protein
MITRIGHLNMQVGTGHQPRLAVTLLPANVENDTITLVNANPLRWDIVGETLYCVTLDFYWRGRAVFNMPVNDGGSKVAMSGDTLTVSAMGVQLCIPLVLAELLHAEQQQENEVSYVDADESDAWAAGGTPCPQGV